MVNSRIFQWNTLATDLLKLYFKLIDLGMEHKDGQIYLADLDKT